MGTAAPRRAGYRRAGPAGKPDRRNRRAYPIRIPRPLGRFGNHGGFGLLAERPRPGHAATAPAGCRATAPMDSQAATDKYQLTATNSGPPAGGSPLRVRPGPLADGRRAGHHALQRSVLQTPGAEWACLENTDSKSGSLG